MRLLHGIAIFAMLASLLAMGCVGQRRTVASQLRAMSPRERSDLSQKSSEAPSLSNVSTIQITSATEISPASQEVDETHENQFGDQGVLLLDDLIAEVHCRNPSIQAAHAAWAAAAERYPQAVALDDPMFQSMFAPASFAQNESQSSYYLGFAQRVPWQGKRQIKGQIAQWEANAASWDAEEVKRRLTSSTRLAFYDYFLVQRELELNDKNAEVMDDFRDTAKTKYEANQVSQQDLSAADLELAKLKQQRLGLEKSRWIATARINTLLHERPDHLLPPPPKQLSYEIDLPDVSRLFVMATEHRPELSAIAARIQAEQNAVALACKEYYPDFEFMGRYDSFWTDRQQRPQVGMNMNVPIRKDRRSAAVREAQFRVTKLSAEYAQLEDSINEQVQVAYAQTQANVKSAELYRSTILPTAETNLANARAAYISGSIDFLRLLEARRQYIDEQVGYQRVLTELHRGHSELVSAVGTSFDSQYLGGQSSR